MRDVEFFALTDWIADDPAAGATPETELAADWTRSVAALRWSRLAVPGAARTDGVARPA